MKNKKNNEVNSFANPKIYLEKFILEKEKNEKLVLELEKNSKIFEQDNVNTKKYLDKKIRVYQAKIKLLNQTNVFYNKVILDINQNEFKYTSKLKLKNDLNNLLKKEKNLLSSEKKSKNKRYIKSFMCEKQKVTLNENIVKYESSLEKQKNKYQKLVLKKEKGGFVRIETIVKVGKKVENIKTKIKRNSIGLQEVEDLTFEMLNPVDKIKKWFSQIEYRKQKTIWGLIFLIPFLVGMFGFFLPSLLKTFYWSFNKITIDGTNMGFDFNGFENYVYLFQSFTIDSSNIFKVAIFEFIQNLAIDLPIILIFALIVATMLNTKFKGSTIVKAIFFVPVVFNFTIIKDALSGGMGQMIEGEMNANFAFIANMANFLLEVGIGQGFVTFIISAVDRIFTIVNLSGIQILLFTAALQSIPSNLYEAAKVEGATKYETFWKITFPMVSPILLTGAIFTVVDSFVRSPIYRFIDQAQTTFNNYGLANAIAISYLVINILIIGVVLFLMKGLVFYYDKR